MSAKKIYVLVLNVIIELSAAATIIDWWQPVMPDAAWSAIFLVLIITVNLVGVRYVYVGDASKDSIIHW